MKLCQGHQSAFGAGIYDKDIDLFVELTDNLLKDIEFTKRYLVDFIFQANDININTILELGSYKSYWGQYIDEPYIAIENVKLNPEDIQLIGERQTTIKIKLP